MKHRQKLAGLLAGVFLTSLVLQSPVAFAAGTDLSQEHAAISEEKILTHYVSGYPDGTIQPDAEVTRAQLAAFITRLAGGRQ